MPRSFAILLLMLSWRAVTLVLIVVGCGGNKGTPRALSSPPTIEVPMPEDSRISLARIVVGQPVLPRGVARTDEGHTPASLAFVVRSHDSALAACTGPQGLLTLYLEIGEQGRVVGGSTMPPPGEEGLSAVSGCVLRGARTWRFPGRGVGGSTILIVPLVWNGHSAR